MYNKLRTFLCIPFLLLSACSNNSIDIDILSSFLRDRIVLTDVPLMRKVLFVSFQVNNLPQGINTLDVFGSVSCGKNRLAEYSIKTLQGRYGDLVFDLPYDMPEGKYDIEIKTVSEKEHLCARKSISIDSSKLKLYFTKKHKGVRPNFEKIPQPKEKRKFIPSRRDEEIGYIVFARPPLEYVFPGARPDRKEIIVDGFGLTVTQSEFEPITFTLYPLQDLGWVSILISDLVGQNGIVSRKYVQIAHVEEIESTVGLPQGKYRKLPALLRPKNRVEVKKGRCERFWLTVKIEPDIKPGIYEGVIYIKPQFGEEKSLPLEIKVVPITLTDIPGLDYFMLMTYEFVELTMPWDERSKRLIYNSALKILQDYKEHGMTTICLHSPFVQIQHDDGTLNLEDILAALHAVKQVGFTRPIIYYLGHLIHTAKQMHPGNINSFEEHIEIPRLRSIVKKVTEFAEESNCPEVIFCPIDEPHDKYNDPSGKRLKITPLLLKAIHQTGAKTMVTSHIPFNDVDYLCSGKVDKKALYETHKEGKRYWIYDNSVTLKATNPAYARYKYGYYAWREGIDGMASWTFQTTQNARGIPGVADTLEAEAFLAYPDPKGPLATLRWEAIREGIDDHKLIYQLEKRIQVLDQIGVNTNEYLNYLSALRQKSESPGLDSQDYNGWTPDFFENNRKKLIQLILDADAKIESKTDIEKSMIPQKLDSVTGCMLTYRNVKEDMTI